MKLLTHNILTSKMLKNVTTGYPLQLIASKIETTKADYQPEFIERMVQRLNYDAFYSAAQSIGHSEGLPSTTDFNENQNELLKNEDVVKRLHEVLLEVEVIEGDLVCPETGRKFPIQNGIPNMLVCEDEIQ